MKYLIYLFLFTGIKTGVKEGTASYYSNKFEGRKTASGEIFRQSKFTAASNYYNLGDTVVVTNISNNKKVKVVINDRMGNRTRIIDLSKAAAKEIGMIKKGIVEVKVVPVG